MNVADLLEFLAAFGTVAGESGFNAAYDFDGNGAIGVADLMHLLASFDPANGGSLMEKGGK